MSNHRTLTVGTTVAVFACLSAAAMGQQLKIGKNTGISGPAAGAVLYVPAEYDTIQDAIDAAERFDTVVVADGVYSGPGNIDLDFGGKAITVKSAGGAALCVIDCKASQEDPHRGFNFHSGEGRDSVVDGFTIINGSTPQGAIADEFNGAGILCTEGSSPTIQNCVLSHHWAGCWGAAICCSFQSHPLIKNCTITDNYSDDDGGAVFAWSGSQPTIMNSLIANNGALITGGGVTNFSNATIEIINSTIVGNDAPFSSAVFGSNVLITNSIIYGNVGQDFQVSPNADITYSMVEGGHNGEGNLDVDPMFVDPDNGDYHLMIGSPLIDAGDMHLEGVLEGLDIDGEPRVLNGLIDIGADEVDVDTTGLTDTPDFRN